MLFSFVQRQGQKAKIYQNIIGETKMKKILTLFIFSLLFLILALNCGGDGEKKTKTVSQVNTTEGADSSVTAEMGGNGFEEIASNLGYQTYFIKPEEKIYKHLLNDLEISPEKCVFLDDLGVNLKTARRIGIHTIKVNDPKAAISELDNILEIE